MAGTPGQSVADENLLNQAAALPPELLAFIARMGVDSQQQIQTWPYYSRFFVAAQKTGAAPGPYTYTIPKGSKVRPFAYGVQQNDVIASIVNPPLFIPPVPATFADTNLISAYKTTQAQRVMVWGMMLLLSPKSDYCLVRGLMDNMSVALLGQGLTVAQKLGALGMHMGRTGLHGLGSDSLRASGLLETTSPLIAAPTFGNPVPRHFFPFPYGVAWTPSGSSADETFGLELEVVREVQCDADADRPPITIDVGAEDPAIINTPWLAPDLVQMDVMVELVVTSEATRSENQ